MTQPWNLFSLLVAVLTLCAGAGCSKKPSQDAPVATPDAGVLAVEKPAPEQPVLEKPEATVGEEPLAEAPPPGGIDCRRICDKPIECAKAAGATPEGIASAEQARAPCVDGCESAVKAGIEGALEPLRAQSGCAGKPCADYGRCVADAMRGPAATEPAPEDD